MITIAEFMIMPIRKNVFNSKTDCFIPDDLFDDLCDRYPEFAKRNRARPTAAQRFHNNFTVDPNRPYDYCDIKAPYDGEAVQTILFALADAGFSPISSIQPADNPRHYTMYLCREYSHDELEQFEYFRPRPDKQFGRFTNRALCGSLNVWRDELTDTALIGRNGFFILVKDALYQEMKNIEWKHLQYRSAIACKDGEEEPDPRYRGPAIWELVSDIALPKTTSTLIDSRGKPFCGDFTQSCILDEGMHRYPELHYRRCDFEKLESFDFAVTYERFGKGDPASFPYLICSKKFYHFCSERKLDVRWIPVRIDDE